MREYNRNDIQKELTDKEVERGEVTNVFRMIEMGSYGLIILILLGIFIPYGWTLNLIIAIVLLLYSRKIQRKIKEREEYDKKHFK